jgi:ATP-binding cassette subfamily C protein
LFYKLFQTWIRFLTHVGRHFRLRFAILLALTIFAGLIDSIGMALLLPLLNLIGVGMESKGPIPDIFRNVFHLVGIQPTLESVLFAIVAVFLFQSGLVVLQGRFIADIEASYVSQWREKLIRKMLGASWAFFAGIRGGGLTYLVITEAERLGRTFFLSIQLLAGTVVAIAYVTLSITISWIFTLFLITALLLMALLLFQYSASKSFKIGHEYSLHLADLQAMISDFVIGAKLFKASATETFVLDKLRPIQELIGASYFGGVVIPYVLKAVMELGAIVLFCGLIFFGIRFIDIEPEVLLVLLAIFFRLVPKLHNLQYNLQLLLTYLPAFARLEAICEELDRNTEFSSLERVDSAVVKCPSIVMEGVSVTYDGREVLTFSYLDIPANISVGIIGPSGAGKSTLVDILLGLVLPKKGSVKFDGIHIGEINLRQWRSSVGYVAQDTVLFSGTVREVILQGRDICDEDLYVAAKMSRSHEFILRLPYGYDTEIGQSGVQLSGGERQRLSLARALAGKPVMVILDEPTSALDSISEHEIVTALKELRGKITVIIVSHRASIVRDADKIVVIDRGQIVSVGNWDELGGNVLVNKLMNETSFGY